MSTRITNPLQDAAHDAVDTEGQRRPGTNAVHKSSRARPHKDQYGWANLPAELVQKIVTLVNDDLELDLVLRRGIHPAKMPVALAFKRQQWLCQARLVSSGWCTAVNSHSFWAEYAALLRPGYENEPTRGSTTLFHQAHRITVPVCIPCALSPYPSRGYPADPRRITLVRRLGRVPTCRDHYQKFCANCMTDASVSMRDPTVRDGANLNLRQMDSGDRDEQGVYRPIGSVACLHCRDAAIITALRSELAECARGWAFSGIGMPWDSALPIKEYMFYGEGKSDIQAKRAVEDMFLARHTRWLEYERDMLVIQRTLLGIKCHYFTSRIPVPQRVEVDTINTLWSRIFDGERDSLEFDLARFYRAWTNEIERGDYTEHEYRGDLERYMSQTVMFLWPILRDMLINASIDNWIRDRVYYGYWITPSDELDQIVAPGSNVHTPFPLMAQHAHNPHDGPDGPHHLVLLMRREGLFRPPRSANDPTWFLPPQRILQMMDSKFASELTRQIESPLTEIVEWHKDNEYGDADAAERTCASWGVSQILNTLRMPDAWIEGSLVLKREPKGGNAATRSWSGPVSDAGGGSVVSDAPESPRIEVVKTDAAPEADFLIKDGWGSSVHQDDDVEEEDGWIDEDDHRSDDMEDEDEWEDEFPVDKVDPSTDSRAVEPDCGEHDRSSSVTARVNIDEDEDDAHPEATLGKRKTSDDERTDEDEREERPTRPRLGSGQTSHSSEGDGASTALITPDDSPGLLAGSIQLAAEHDDDDTATMSVSDSTPVAVVNVHGVRARSPSSSPNLGKRKSPDGDLHSERPVRRRGSHSTLTPSSTESAGSSMSDGSDTTEVKRVDEPMDTTVVDASVTAEAPAVVAIVVETTTVETAIQAVKVESPPADTSLPPGVLATDALRAPPQNVTHSPMDGVTLPERKMTPISEDTPISSNEEGNLNDEPAVDSVSDTPVGRSPSAMSYDESSEFDSELDMPPDMTPYVPGPNTKLGPGATKLIETAWWQAREPLRECRCTICERARVVETNMALFAFGLESQGIRIA